MEIYHSRFEGKEFRHQYHLLSEVILKLDGEQLDNIPRNLKRFTEYYFKYRDRDEEMIKLVKLYDYLSIEIKRNRDRWSIEELTKKISEEKNKIDDISKNVDDLERSLNNHQLQIVSALGIFSAIIFVFVGGFEFLSAAVSNIEPKSAGCSNTLV